MTNDERHLDELFLKYKSACPDAEASKDFMPKLWAGIENKRSFSLVFEHLGRIWVKASVATCLLLAALNMIPPSATHTKYATYADVLSAETTVERTYPSDLNPAYNLPADYQL